MSSKHFGLQVNTHYSRKKLAIFLSTPNIESSREGIYRIGDCILMFVTLNKEAAIESVKYNDYFDGDIFFWESQNRQSITSPIIQSIIGGDLVPLLFVRERAKVRGETQEFVYAGRLAYLDHDPNSSNPVKLAFAAADIAEPIRMPLRSLMAWKPAGTHTANIPTTLIKNAKQKRATRSGTSQGFEADPLIRSAIELWAMEKARKTYEKNGYVVSDVSKSRPYDLLCQKPTKKSRRVEVKGTRGDGSTIILTGNEVRSALDAQAITDLAICSGIEVAFEGDVPRAHSGTLRVIQGWTPDQTMLEPTEYRYTVPKE